MLTSNDLGSLRDAFEVKKFKKGEVIFPQGQIANGAYVVLSGLVHLVKKHKVENIVEHLGNISAGDSFGAWYVLFESKLRPVSAFAKEDSELVFVPNEVLKEKLKNCDPFIIYCFRKWIDLMRHKKVPEDYSEKKETKKDPVFDNYKK